MGVTTTTVLAYLLIICYFIMERLLRKGEKALSLQTGEFDREIKVHYSPVEDDLG